MTSQQRQGTDPAVNITLRVREFGIPPVHDGLVLGRQAPIGCVAMQKALSLLHASPFEHLEVADDVVKDVLIRTNILLRVPRERLLRIVIERVKPVMAANEIIHLDIDAELLIEDQV